MSGGDSRAYTMTIKPFPTNEPTDTSLEELYEMFKALSPKERNDLLQALYSAKLTQVEDIGASIELFKALMKSFNISVKYAELEDNDDHDVI